MKCYYHQKVIEGVSRVMLKVSSILGHTHPLKGYSTEAQKYLK